MDIFLGGTGFSFKAAMETADKKDRNHFFKVNNVTVDVKNMNIKLKQSNHKLLFGLVKPLLLRVMRPILQKVLSAQIKKSIDQVDAIAWEIHLDAKKAEKAAANDPEDSANIYQRYFQAAQNRLSGDKDKKRGGGDGKVNVAMTQHDSLFKNVTLPGGISTKATEFKDLAAKGEKWESPVFGIGSAKESSSIPKVAQVTRKQHSVTPSTVRGSQNVSSGNTQPNGTSAFSNQVDGAFASNPTTSDYSLKGNTNPNGTANTNMTSSNVGSNMASSANTAINPNTSTHTTLGSSNPILQGRV